VSPVGSYEITVPSGKDANLVPETFSEIEFILALGVKLEYPYHL